MRIDTVAHALPAQLITTDWIVEKLRRVNGPKYSGAQLDEMEQIVRGFLDAAGSDRKYQATNGERAIDLAAEACGRALTRANCRASDVDLLLYTSVSRGCLEPATANLLQARAGLSQATCFDILDGCAGWLRGLEVAHALLRSGRYARAMIVSGECGMEAFGKWEFESSVELSDYLATYTIGEAATATVVSATGDDDFYMRFENRGEHAGLCMIPLASAHHFVPEEILARPADRFYAKSRELLFETTTRIVELYRSDPYLSEQEYDIGFGHAASERIVEIIRRELGIAREAYFPIHARFGNTVSASVPLAMSVALEEGRLLRGHKVLVVVGASGISVGLASFTF